MCRDVTEQAEGKRRKSLISNRRNLIRIAYEPRGRGFKSCRARQTFQRLSDALGLFRFGLFERRLSAARGSRGTVGQFRRRRLLIAVCTLFAQPLIAGAQQRLPVVGYLGAESPERFVSRLRAFRDGLAESGFFEGRNVAIEYRWAEGQNARLPELAADLVRRQVAVIAAPGSIASALAAKAATRTIPVVFEVGADPVASGLVANLSHPGGNVTGVTSLNTAIGAKRVQLLHELIPEAKSLALLVNPTNPGNAEPTMRESQNAARALGIQLHVLQASTEIGRAHV